MTIKKAVDNLRESGLRDNKPGLYSVWIDLDKTRGTTVKLTINVRTWYPSWLVGLILKYRVHFP